jgi:prepilin-type N-terminal cleavage/methylation domain-containing protein
MISLRSQRGISLLEVLASVTLFGIAAAGLSAGTMANIRGNSSSRAAATASALILDRIEQFRALDQTTNPADLTSGTHQDPLNPIDGLGRAGGSFRRSWVVNPNTPRKGLSEVIVTVTWLDPIPRSLTGVTFVCGTDKCS